MKFKNKEVPLKDIKVFEEIIENEKVVNIQTFNDPTGAIKAFYKGNKLNQQAHELANEARKSIE